MGVSHFTRILMGSLQSNEQAHGTQMEQVSVRHIFVQVVLHL